ncbi:MAG: hypothetical protein WBS19_15300 [Candidatus Korobacteraceae bacterium]
MIYAVVGFFVAILLILLFALVGHLAKAKLERWRYELNRETHRQLHEAELKLDSIVTSQERILSHMERLSTPVRT